MLRLLKIEWLKLRNYRAFWLMVGLYLFILFAMIFSLPALLDFLGEKTNESTAIDAFKTVAFNFSDIWQNISFIAGLRWFLKIFLALLVLIFISNEFTYGTIRSNIINGLSRTQFMFGKLGVVLLLSLISTFALLISGLYLGFKFSATQSFGAIVGGMGWLVYYFIEIYTYLTFALMIGIIIRRTGFAIITMLSYNFIELIAQYYVNENYEKFLPLNAMNGIINGVNTSMIQVKTPEFNLDDIIIQESVAASDIGICLLYLALIVGIIYLYLRKKDL